VEDRIVIDPMICHGKPVIRGTRTPKGEKLCMAEKLIRQGHPISILNETEFLKLLDL
jgi:hypothetical protein